MSAAPLIAGVVFFLIMIVAIILFSGIGRETKKGPSPSPAVQAVPAVPVVEKYRYVRIYRDKDGDDHWMNLSQVKVFSGGVDVASGKTVTERNRYPGAVIATANLVDGNPQTIAHTDNQAVEWFLIDLGQEYEIEKVEIHNRLDCCQARLRNTKIQLSKSADMSSPKESRPITLTESTNAIVTWNVKSNTITTGGYEWGLMDPNVEHNWSDGEVNSYEECRDVAKIRGHLAWGVQTGYHSAMVEAGKSIGGCWTRPNLTNYTRLMPGDIAHVAGCADPTKNVSSRCV